MSLSPTPGSLSESRPSPAMARAGEASKEPDITQRLDMLRKLCESATYNNDELQRVLARLRGEPPHEGSKNDTGQALASPGLLGVLDGIIGTLGEQVARQRSLVDGIADIV